jgi:hypothetical protein
LRLAAILLALFLTSAIIRPGAVDADFPAAELSPQLVFECLPDRSVSVELRWASSYQGPQWLDVSLFDNAFAPGTFAGFGPLPVAATSFATPGLAGGAVYFARVNTLTTGGWAASPTLIFATPNDCPSTHLPPGISAGPEGCPDGCVWTDRLDYASYAAGELVHYCFYLPVAGGVRIITLKPDGTTLVVVDGFVNGTSGCAGPFLAAEPFGLRTVLMYGGSADMPVSQWHFVVR